MLAEWVDDVYLQGPTDKAIDKALADLKASGMDYSDSGCLSDYLGLGIERTSSTFVLRQTGLIDKILSTIGLEDCNSVRLPMENPVGACLSSPPRDEPWDYAAALGLMTYLSIQTRPDIAVAVNILARYSSNPHAEHTAALKHLARYLQGTRHFGLIMRCDMNGSSLDCYVDADFASMFGHEDALSKTSAQSRTGFIIYLFGCPIFWSSNQQKLVALSSLESEYIALSTAVRDVLHLRNIVQDNRVKH